MDWIRENKSWATIVGVFAAGGLAMGGVLLMSHFSYAESLEQLASIAGKVAKQEKEPLYPSAANVDALADKVAEYEGAVSGLGDVLLKLQPPVKDITDTDFVAKLKQDIAKTRQKAEAASIKLPKDFALGFDAYTKALPQSPEAARQLNDYVDAVGAVVNTVLDSGVTAIDSLQRSELTVEKPTATAPVAPVETSKKKAKAPLKTKGKGGKAIQPAKEIAKVVERRQMSLAITTDQKAFQALMNALASPSKMPYFTVIRVARVENEKQEGPLRNAPLTVDAPIKIESAPEIKPVDGAAASAAPKAEVITAPKPAAPDAVAVMGKEALHVSLDIDLVRFLAPDAASTAGTN